jgi:folate-binding protein YgfZ
MLDAVHSQSSGAFEAAPDEFAALRRGPVLARLDSLGRIRIDGPDALSFLQTQLTNDVAGLGETDFQLNGYCTAKGRMLATFHQWRDAAAVILQLPKDVLPSSLKRLSMFVLRSKAKLVDDSARLTAFGLLGPGAADALRAAGIEPPTEAWSMTTADGISVARMPAAPETGDRFMLLVDAENHAEGKLGAAAVSEGIWWWSEIGAAVPTVFASTQERFVPQMINFEVLGGVSFKKGCYPGQEIVARSQYLGKLKRRMRPGHVDAQLPAAGADVFHSGAASAVGNVVMSATAPGGGSDVLFEVPVEKLQSGELRLGATDGALIEVRPLPYELFDPTA